MGLFVMPGGHIIFTFLVVIVASCVITDCLTRKSYIYPEITKTYNLYQRINMYEGSRGVTITIDTSVDRARRRRARTPLMPGRRVCNHLRLSTPSVLPL